MLNNINVLDKGYVQLIDHMGNDMSIVHAARVSLNKDVQGESSIGEGELKLLKYLLVHKHTSPFEHVVFTFLVKCPLFIRSQWHRHRTWSYNEVSRRYTSEDIDFYIPGEFRKQAVGNKQASTDEKIYKLANGENIDSFIYNLSSDLLTKYYDLLQAGVAREQARMILPQNMYTRFYGTVDLWNLLHFIELRNDPHSQYEMQLYGQALEDLIVQVVPFTFSIWKELK